MVRRIAGSDNYNLGKYEAAVADYDKAIELDPKQCDVFCRRGNAKYYLGNYEAAIADYDRAIELDPKDAFAFGCRGLVNFVLVNDEAAIADCDKAIELDPTYAAVFACRGDAKYNLGKYEAAVADYDKAIELRPKYANAFHRRGDAKRSLGNYEAAIADYDKAIELDPKYAAVFACRGHAQHTLGKYEAAMGDFENAIGLEPGNPWTWFFRGVCAGKIGWHERAAQDYSKATQLDPNFADLSRKRRCLSLDEPQSNRARHLEKGIGRAISDLNTLLAECPEEVDSALTFERSCCVHPETFFEVISREFGTIFVPAKSLFQGAQVIAANGKVVEVLHPPEQHRVPAVIELRAGLATLVVSPDHRILVPGTTGNTTVPAKDLQQHGGVAKPKIFLSSFVVVSLLSTRRNHSPLVDLFGCPGHSGRLHAHHPHIGGVEE